MNAYEIFPGIGAGPVRFGMSRSEARRAMQQQGMEVEQFTSWRGAPVLAAEDSGFQVRFDQAERVFEIQLSGLPNEARKEGARLSFLAVFDGIDIFSTKAVDVISAIDSPAVRGGPAGPADADFPSLGLLLWRDDKPPGNIERRSPYFEGLLLRKPESEG